MKDDSSVKVIPLIRETYLAVINNSVDSRIFQNFYAKVDGLKKDIMKGGELSCAFFVSSILSILKLAKGMHGTVDGTIKDIIESGWVEINEPRIGSIIVWEKLNFNGEEHKHIGFCVGNDEAISNSYLAKTPKRHNLKFDNKRKITNIFWNEKLN